MEESKNGKQCKKEKREEDPKGAYKTWICTFNNPPEDWR